MKPLNAGAKEKTMSEKCPKCGELATKVVRTGGDYSLFSTEYRCETMTDGNGDIIEFGADCLKSQLAQVTAERDEAYEAIRWAYSMDYRPTRNTAWLVHPAVKAAMEASP
jgi:hypothetical protein